jgi:superfamily II helicase
MNKSGVIAMKKENWLQYDAKMNIRQIEKNKALCRVCDFCNRQNYEYVWEIEAGYNISRQTAHIYICENCLKEILQYRDAQFPKEKSKYVRNTPQEAYPPTHDTP